MINLSLSDIAVRAEDSLHLVGIIGERSQDRSVMYFPFFDIGLQVTMTACMPLYSFWKMEFGNGNISIVETELTSVQEGEAFLGMARTLHEKGRTI